jgi:hypothetical protein
MNLNVFRFAAYALVRAGRLQAAVEVLELGRAQQLRLWMQQEAADLDAVSEFAPELAERLVDLRAELETIEARERAGEGAADAASVADALTDVVAEIRRLPGLEGFLERPTFESVALALGDGDALVYLVSSPEGTAAIIVHAGGGTLHVSAVDASEVSAPRLFRVFMDLDDEATPLGGFLLAHLEGDMDALSTSITSFAELLGPTLLEPLQQQLIADGIQAVRLVPVSLLALIPLHALAWEARDGATTLLDAFEISYAPSALALSVCRRRAAARVALPGRLVVVGNPLPHRSPLPGAEHEARLIAATLPAESLEMLIGEDATHDHVIASLTGATHVHFACHGAASFFDPAFTAALSLAHEQPLGIQELLEIPDFAPRLVVASACETGVIQGYSTADESLTLASLFVGAGAAGVVATLWAVDDYATALSSQRERSYERTRLAGEAQVRRVNWQNRTTSRSGIPPSGLHLRSPGHRRSRDRLDAADQD